MVCVFGLWHLSCFLFFQILRSAILCSIDLRKFSAIIALNIFFLLVLFSGILIINMLHVMTLFHISWMTCFLDFFFSFVSSLNFSLRRFFWHLLVRCFFPWLWAIGEYTDEPIKGILHPCPTGFLIVCLLLRLFFRVVSGIGQNWAESIEVFHLFLYMHSLSHYQPE